MAVEKSRRYGIVEGSASTSTSAEGKQASSYGPIATLAGRPLLSNRGIPLNLDWVKQVRVNTSAVERRAQSHVLRRTVKKEWQAAWLLRAITCMDLTTLSGDDTDERVRRLVREGAAALAAGSGREVWGSRNSKSRSRPSACITRSWRRRGTRWKARGYTWRRCRLDFRRACRRWQIAWHEIRRSVDAGAQEIDVVITRAHVFGGRWQALYDEIAAFKQACGTAHMKVILGTGDLLTLRNVGRASCCRHDGGSRFHQDLYWQGADERDPAGGLRDDARDPRIRAGNRHGGGVQAGGRDPDCEAIDSNGWR